MTTRLGTLETLTHARGLLATGGWVQGDYVQLQADGTCKRCAYGALEGWYAHREGDLHLVEMRICPDGHAVSLLRLAMDEVDPVGNSITHGIATWNDSPGRTEEQVLQAFDLAITKAREELAA